MLFRSLSYPSPGLVSRRGSGRLFLFLLAFLIMLTASESPRATAQLCERLIIRDSTYALASTPLEPLLDSTGHRPIFYFLGLATHSSDCWRDYVATWKIDRDSLWLAAIEVQCVKDTSGAKDKPYEHVFCSVPVDSFVPGAKAPACASWYTGLLRVPKGNRVRYVHMGFGSIYERELHISVESGRVTRTEEIGYDTATEYRSTSDLQWCAITGTFVDTGNWIDARLIGTEYTRELESSGRPFKTRGDLYVGDGRIRLWIEKTPRTKEKTIDLISESHINEDDISGPVEVEVRFWGPRRQHQLLLLSMRHLGDGETIHSDRYPTIVDSLHSLHERKGK